MSFLFLSTLVVVLAGLHPSEALGEYFKVKCFNFGVGKSAIAIYTAPSKEGATVDLMDSKSNILLHMNYRLEQKVLVLNTKPAGGSWGGEQRVHNFYITPGEKIRLTAIGEDGQFAIIGNGHKVTTYKYRLPVESMEYMWFYASHNSGSRLLSMIC